MWRILKNVNQNFKTQANFCKFFALLIGISHGMQDSIEIQSFNDSYFYLQHQTSKITMYRKAYNKKT